MGVMKAELPPPPPAKRRDPWKTFGVAVIGLVLAGAAIGVGFLLGSGSSGDAALSETPTTTTPPTNTVVEPSRPMVTTAKDSAVVATPGAELEFTEANAGAEWRALDVNTRDFLCSEWRSADDDDAFARKFANQDTPLKKYRTTYEEQMTWARFLATVC